MQVGQTVVLKEHPREKYFPQGSDPRGIGWGSGMNRFIGVTLTVSEIREIKKGYPIFRIKEDNGDNVWDGLWFSSTEPLKARELTW
jgi:hypothetical protein